MTSFKDMPTNFNNLSACYCNVSALIYSIHTMINYYFIEG